MPRCWALRVDGNGRYVCDRPDPHPDGFGSDSEGHRWVPASGEQWVVALTVQEALNGGVTILKSGQP
jgi:sugar lactone lactonase YvrE